MFHSYDGWFFKRDGAVVVILQGNTFEDAKEVVRFPPNEWASIVASVSELGETSESWRTALVFHDTESAKPYIDEQGSPANITISLTFVS